MPQRAWLLDASIYIFRAWFSMPDRWHSDDGMPLNAVYGYASFLCDFLSRIHPATHIAAAFDESLGTCFRKEICADYKASRVLPDEALAFQLQCCRELTELSGIECFGGESHEADDYIATLARLAREQDCAVTVVTRDKDLGQVLLSEGDLWWDFAADQTLDADGFSHRFGVSPAQFADYQGLVGDSIDDIPGVPGVGPKTAAVLIKHFGDLESIEQGMDEVKALSLRGAARLPEKLSRYWSHALLSRELARLEQRVPEVEVLPSFTLERLKIQAVSDYLLSLGLSGPILKRWEALGEAL